MSETSSRSSEAVKMEVSSVSNNLTSKLLRLMTIVILPSIRLSGSVDCWSGFLINFTMETSEVFF